VTHIDLFSGIGGFALAARWAGLETVQFVEIDKFCQKVLAKHFPGVPIHEDIKTYSYPIGSNGGSKAGNALHEGRPAGEDRGTGIPENAERGNGFAITDHQSTAINGDAERSRPFLLTGGFPCQPFSCAGKRRGKEDDRYLWPEMLRVVSEAKPDWVIGENVGGFVNMGLDECISDLEHQGYEVQPFIIPACAVNAPHRRDRVWIVGHATGSAKREIGSVREGQSANGDRGDQCAQSSCISNWSEPWLKVATCLCRVDDGIPRQVDRVNRLKALGNAIVPQVAYEIMKAIISANMLGES
jgi:DNA (cytosine-5)-methyltransferase 1